MGQTGREPTGADRGLDRFDLHVRTVRSFRSVRPANPSLLSGLVPNAMIRSQRARVGITSSMWRRTIRSRSPVAKTLLGRTRLGEPPPAATRMMNSPIRNLTPGRRSTLPSPLPSVARSVGIEVSLDGRKKDGRTDRRTGCCRNISHILFLIWCSGHDARGIDSS